ncbi:hypothetical protein KC19_9G154800 [Ceratodon purpureus]|uniref:Uncharacterized protein n=1 Tax=Ceratodon purpureus TaxID=3225 RepID=A0A8T0GS94_CERPU|nr:hypothetical protein KC19_9G154800 [Ceratodon purpureus]
MNRYVGIADDDNSGRIFRKLHSSLHSSLQKPIQKRSGVHKIARLVNAVPFHVGSINCAHVK